MVKASENEDIEIEDSGTSAHKGLRFQEKFMPSLSAFLLFLIFDDKKN